MSKTNGDHTLDDAELDAVAGGVVVEKIGVDLFDYPPPANAAAMAVWNRLLRQNGL
jgi:hypothetical protein